MSVGIYLDRVTKRFRSTVALDKTSLSVDKGMNIVIGPNGAGKSTLLRCIGGLYRPDSGSVRIFGKDPYYDDEARGMVSLLSDNYALYDKLPVIKNLLFFGKLYGNSDSDTIDMSRMFLKKLDAYQYINRKAGELSRGTKQKVAICRALLGNPDVFLLDEPTAFLDAASAEKVHIMLEEFASDGKVVLYATQRLNEAARFNANLFIIKKGRISKSLRHSDLYGSILKGARINIKLADPLTGAIAKKVPRFNAVLGSNIRITVRNYKDINEAIKYLIGKGAYIVSVDYSEPLIEDML